MVTISVFFKKAFNKIDLLLEPLLLEILKERVGIVRENTSTVN